MENYRFSHRWIYINNFFDMKDTKIKKSYHRVCLVEPVRKMYFLNFKGQFQNFTSGQVMTQVGQYAHHPKRLDEANRFAPFVRLYLHPIVTYWRKTDCGLI